jgi:hypothetical protein
MSGEGIKDIHTHPSDMSGLDSKYRWYMRDYRMARVKELGYDSIFGAIHALYVVQGMSLHEVGKKLDMSFTTVKTALEWAGWPRRERGGANHKGRTDVPREEIRRLCPPFDRKNPEKRSDYIREQMTRYGLCYQTVVNIINNKNYYKKRGQNGEL